VCQYFVRTNPLDSDAAVLGSHWLLSLVSMLSSEAKCSLTTTDQHWSVIVSDDQLVLLRPAQLMNNREHHIPGGWHHRCITAVTVFVPNAQYSLTAFYVGDARDNADFDEAPAGATRYDCLLATIRRHGRTTLSGFPWSLLIAGDGYTSSPPSPVLTLRAVRL